MLTVSQDNTTFPQEDNRRLFYVRNYEWALRMTFRYLGKYEIAVSTVHDTFLRLFLSAASWKGMADPHGQPSDVKGMKKIFIKAAVNAALQEAEQDTTSFCAGQVQTYLRELAVWDGEGADTPKYRNAITQLLLLPLYPRLAYNICIIEGCSGNEAAELLGIKESQVAGHVHKARILLKNSMTKSFQ